MADEQKLYNDDILGFIDRLDRFALEVNKSASANVTEYTEHDLSRLRSYIASMRTYISWVVAQPQLDLPETHPLELSIPEAPQMADADNPMVRDVIRLLLRLRAETIRSQSARKASGIITHDQGRMTALIDKMDKFLSDYVDQVQPVDLPESSPKGPVTGPGN